MTAMGSDTRLCDYGVGLRRGRREVASPAMGGWARSAWAIANVAFDGKEEAASFACGQFAWNSLLREIDKILGGLKNPHDASVFFIGHDHDPRAIRIEGRACRSRPLV